MESLGDHLTIVTRGEGDAQGLDEPRVAIVELFHHRNERQRIGTSRHADHAAHRRGDFVAAGVALAEKMNETADRNGRIADPLKAGCQQRRRQNDAGRIGVEHRLEVFPEAVAHPRAVLRVVDRLVGDLEEATLQGQAEDVVETIGRKARFVAITSRCRHEKARCDRVPDVADRRFHPDEAGGFLGGSRIEIECAFALEEFQIAPGAADVLAQEIVELLGFETIGRGLLLAVAPVFEEYPFSCHGGTGELRQ